MCLKYHLGKANVVADSLSHFSIDSVYHVKESKKKQVREAHRFDRLGLKLKILLMMVLWYIITPSQL